MSNERRRETVNKYQRRVPSTLIDVYDVLKAFEVHCPAVAHGIKKALCPGTRGTKGKLQDLREARDSLNRAIDLEEEVIPE